MKRKFPVRSADSDTKIAKIVFTNWFFYPDHSATSQMLSDLAFDLAEPGGDGGGGAQPSA